MTKYTSGNHRESAAIFLQSSWDICRKSLVVKRPVDRSCPVRSTLDHIGSKWAVLVVIVLSERTQRFSELRREIPDISQRMLTQCLRDLERVGVVEREVHPTVPPRVDYRLSPLGRSLLDPLANLIDWAARNRQAMHAARVAFDAQEGPAHMS